MIVHMVTSTWEFHKSYSNVYFSSMVEYVVSYADWWNLVIYKAGKRPRICGVYVNTFIRKARMQQTIL